MSVETIPVPCLGPSGWTRDPALKADILFSHLFETLKSQTNTYAASITSIQYILEKNVGDVNKLIQDLRAALEIYFSRYYDHAMVTIDSDNNNSNMTNKCSLTINIQISEAGKTYSLGKLVDFENSKIKKITSVINA